MLYASTRNNLTKALGSAPFTDSIFATSKADVDAAAYASHRASLAAPKPMTAREREMEEIKVAEVKSAAYDGSRARKSHLGGRVGFQWSPETEQAVKELGEQEWPQGKLVILVRKLSAVVDSTPDADRHSVCRLRDRNSSFDFAGRMRSARRSGQVPTTNGSRYALCI